MRLPADTAWPTIWFVPLAAAPLLTWWWLSPSERSEELLRYAATEGFRWESDGRCASEPPPARRRR